MSNGAVSEFDEVFAREYPRVVALCRRVTGDVETGREVAQEAFIRAFVRWRRIGHYDDPAAWVRKVAVREAIRQAKRRARGRELEGRATADEPLRPPDAAPVDIEALLANLTPQQRAAVTLVWLEDRTADDAAQALGCQPGTVRVHLHRARVALRGVIASPSPADAESARPTPDPEEVP